MAQVRALQDAEAALRAGELGRARDLARSVSDDALAARARFVEGYACYKLGQLDEALRLLQASLVTDRTSSPEVIFLVGLVAFELRRWTLVEQHLAPLASGGQPPWADPARRLVTRAREQATAQRLREARGLHAEAVRRATLMLQARRYAEARQALDQAERASPGDVLNHYYRGYLAYQRHDYAAAREHFRTALRTDPGDVWSSYMLALSLDEGEPDRARLLEQLTWASDPTVSAAARAAMPVVERPGRLRGLSLLLELGTGLDTNPGQVTAASTSFAPQTRMDRPYPSGDQPSATTAEGGHSGALALRGRVDLFYQRQLAPGHLGSVGVRLFEQGFVVGVAGLDQTEIAASLQYSLRARRLDLTAGYEVAVDLLAHSPLMSLHSLVLGVAVPLRPWLSAVGNVDLRWRDVHDDAYEYMQALELGGAASLRGQWRVVLVQAGYQLAGAWASPVETTLAPPPHRPGEEESLTTVYRTDYSFLAHGPQLGLAVSLPWRLSLRGGAWLLWHAFNAPESFQVQPSGAVIWQQSRRDLKIVAGIELTRGLAFGLELGLLFSSVDNLSSLDASAPVDRSYSRRSLLGSLRWRWPTPP